jgi:hypothetical protein
MAEIRIVIEGPPYPEPRYYGEIAWNEHNVYLRHPGGGKDSRHSDGGTRLTSTGSQRSLETRLPTSAVSRELINFISLKPPLSEPPPLRGAIRSTDLVLHTSSAGTMPRLAVEIVSNTRLPGVVAAWEAHSTMANSVQTYRSKGFNQSLLVALAGSRTSVPSTGAA